MAVALDSGAIVAFLDRGDVLHAEADDVIRRHAEAGDNLHVSVIAYAKVLTGTKLGHRDAEVVRGFFADLISEVTPVNTDIADRAAELRDQRRALKMPDALILATADLDREVDCIACADEVLAKATGELALDLEALRSTSRSS